jgi:ribosomal subunit interface protein
VRYLSDNEKTMKINVQGLHTDLTLVIIEYTQKRLSTLSKFVKDDSIVCTVELIKTTNHHKSGDIFKAEGFLKINGEDIYAMSEKEDLYQAVDELRDELERILSSRKDKKITLFRKGAQRIKNIIKGIRS